MKTTRILNKEHNRIIVDFLTGLADGIKNGTIEPINTEITQDLKLSDNYGATKEYISSNIRTLHIEYISKNVNYSLKSEIKE